MEGPDEAAFVTISGGDSIESHVFDSILQRPLVLFGRSITGDLTSTLRREWLVTNGIGGYTSMTLGGIPTRSYHGLLVAALEPPVARTVLVGAVVEWATCDGRRYPLSALEFGDGTVDPRGYVHIESFRLEGSLPVWVFALGDTLVERRVWMDAGQNTTHIRYRHLRGSASVALDLTPLVTYRDFHALSSGQGWSPAVAARVNGATVTVHDAATPFHLIADGGEFRLGGDWFWNIHYRAETARGLVDTGDLFAAGTFAIELNPGESASLTLTTENPDTLTDSPDACLAREQARQRELLVRADAISADPAIQQLVLAADQFIVRRDVTGQPSGKTVIAGYHWFNDWGRDTMISLPGLTLGTGRADEAAGILRTFASFVVDGLLPNNFPDSAGVVPGYNTVDATLWYVLAIRAYYEATGDDALVADLLPLLLDIIDHHVHGTRYGIGVDPADGLLRAGEPGVQLTWMDAKVGEWVVTPRIGKPVEINALWYSALRTLAMFAEASEPAKATALSARADSVRESFVSRFAHAEQDHLADVIDGPGGDDWSIRPNQIFAVSLPFPLLEREAAARVVSAVGRTLATSVGLRSLTPDDPEYRDDYGGDQYRRDSRYHQGPVWTWLAGPYAEALLRVTGDRAAARSVLEPFTDHLRDAGLGSVSEILEGGPPHLARGCVAQAWGVAETLRVWQMLDRPSGKV